MLTKEYQLQDVIDAIKAGHRTEAEAVLSHLIELEATKEQDWLQVAAIALSIGEIQACLAALKLFRKPKEMGLNQLIQCAGLYAEAGQFEKAITLVQPQADKKLPYPAIYHLLGTVKAQLGQLADAKQDLATALNLSPHLGITWFTLASLVNFSKNPTLFEQLQQVYQQHAAATGEDSRHLHYTMAKAYDDRGQWQLAWQSYQKGAEQIAPLSRYNPDEHTEFTQNLIKQYSAEVQHRLPKNNDATFSPIAILGLPRSGTTLLGQMLSCNSQVDGVAELNSMAIACMHLKREQLSKFPEFIRQHGNPQAGTEHIAAVYQRVSRQRIPGQSRIVDKALNLTQYFGIWAQIFPEAKAVFVHRNDEDIAWSCFKTNFRSQAAWSWAPESIAHYMKNERALMTHWKKLYPEKILQVEYAELIRNPEQQLKQICQHLSLPFEASMLQFYRSKTPVLTSSLGQVHQPLFQRDFNIAERYPEFIQRWKSHFTA